MRHLSISTLSFRPELKHIAGEAEETEQATAFQAVACSVQI
jgi:hypothetical protein